MSGFPRAPFRPVLTLARVALPCLVLSGGAAMAQTPQTPQQQAMLRQACTGDYMRFCSRFNPGGPEVEQCFQANMPQLSPQCQGAIAAFTGRRPEGRRP